MTERGRAQRGHGLPLDGGRRGGPFGARAEDDPAGVLAELAGELHDGALQELAALLADTRLFGARASEAGLAAVDQLDGFLADVEARLSQLDASLRCLIRGEGRRASEDVERDLEELVRRFAAKGARIELQVDGPLDDLSPAHSHALLRAIEASLSNVHRHARARIVRIAVRRLPYALEAEVVDDGVGFDVAQTLLRVIRERRVGMSGMADRVHALGGEIAVESGPGGRGTRVALSLPLGRPR